MGDIWHVRGVPEETRRKAKTEAAAAGVGMGEWLVGLIDREVRDRESGVTVVREARPKKLEKPVADAEPVLNSEPVLARAAKKGKACVHGKAKGHNCWQCGGLANV